MDSYHLSISKIEGLQNVSDSYLYIYSGLNILRVLTFDNFESSPVPINKGIFRFAIEDSQSSTLQASISFKSEIFTRYGYHWLPLYTESEKVLEEIPGEVELPRVLVDVQSSFLTPVQETTEESELLEEISEASFNEDVQLLKAKNVGMSIRILELEDILNRQKESFDEEIESIKKEFLEISEGYNQSVQKIKQRDTIIKKMENDFRFKDERIRELANELNSIDEKVREVVEREESILNTLKMKDFEIFQLKKKKSLFIEKGQEVGVRRAEKKFEMERSYLEVLPIRELNIQNSASAFFKPSLSESQSKSVEEDFEKTKKKLFNAEVEISNYKLKNLESLNNKIKNFLSLHKIQDYASLSTELVYSFGNTKINIFSKDNSLFYRASGSVKKIEFFLKNNYQDIQIYRKKNSPQIRLKTASGIDKGPIVFQKSLDRSRAKSSVRESNRSVTPKKQSSTSPNQIKNNLKQI